MQFSVVTHIIATVICQTAGELFVTPRDTEAQVGDTTYFNCSTNLASREIFWHHDDKYIYTGIGIHEPYHERYEIERNASQGSHNLIIHKVQPEDAGQYFCIDDDGIGAKRSAQLIVLVKDPACESSIRLDEVIGPNVFGILPDEVQLLCNVSYRGNIPPQMDWKKVGQTNSTRDGDASHVVIDNRVIYTLKLKGDMSLDNSSYVCQTTRATQNQYRCQTETIKVFYFLGENEKVQTVVVGDKITCVAHNSTMPCSSQWYHNNYTCPLSCDETITAHLLGIYLCTVKCSVRGTDYFYETLKVTVVEPTKPPPVIESADDGSVWLISFIFGLSVIIVAYTLVVLWVLYSPRRREAKSSSEKEKLLAKTNILDLTVLHQEVFILRRKRQDIEVYDSTLFHFKRRMEVDGMTKPESIASCSVYNCLYFVDLSHERMHHGILRIDPINGNLIKTWKLAGVFSQLSVANDTNVIICTFNGSELFEYTADGKLIRVIVLGRNPVDMTQRIRAIHAVKLDNGFFVVCQSDPGEVYLISTKETTSTFERIDEVEILKKFSSESGDLNDSLWQPMYLSVDKGGSILVSDRHYDRVVLMNSNFDEARILLSEEDGIGSPWSTCFNESTGEWFVTDLNRIFVCRVKGETIERQIHNQEDFLDDAL